CARSDLDWLSTDYW
nr:immunoglobulin heavy chain junction region [Macaca mulatta]MOX95907.1 immunoglobulin heavy chain junction region [Macaca mulatta]MOX96708.1 immunoglobulin heavy chain junction region [Macaca mulatta]